MNVKTGDLAIIVGALKSNNGRIVEVGQYIGNLPEDHPARFYQNWWVVLGDNLHTVSGVSTKAAVPDKFLKKIKGGNVTKESVQKYDDLVKELENEKKAAKK